MTAKERNQVIVWLEEEINEVDNEVEFFKEIRRKHRKEVLLRKSIDIIITNRVNKKGNILCKLRLYKNIGLD